jgi:hypothetical protein
VLARCLARRTPQPPPAERCLSSTVAVLHPRPGDISLADRRPTASSGPSGDRLGSGRGGGETGRRISGTPPGRSSASTPEGSPSRHSLPSPLPPPPAPLGAPSRWARFETRVIPRTPVMDATEESLTSALEVVVVGPWLRATLAEIFDHLSRYFQVTTDSIQVKRYRANMFLLQFTDRREADRVLHAPIPQGAELRLVFRRWRRQVGSLFSPLRFKILLSITNLPTLHASSLMSCHTPLRPQTYLNSWQQPGWSTQTSP